MQAGGRIPLIVGRGLTDKARQALGMPATDIFRKPINPDDDGSGSRVVCLSF